MAEFYEHYTYPRVKLTNDQKAERGRKMMNFVRGEVANSDIGRVFHSSFLGNQVSKEILDLYCSSSSLLSGIASCLRHLRDEGFLRSEGGGEYVRKSKKSPSTSKKFVSTSDRKKRINLAYLHALRSSPYISQKSLTAWACDNDRDFPILDLKLLCSTAGTELRTLYRNNPSDLEGALREVSMRILNLDIPDKIMKSLGDLDDMKFPLTIIKYFRKNLKRINEINFEDEPYR